MNRRQLLNCLLKAITAWTGFAVVQGLPPVTRINAVRLGNEAWGADCIEELCAVDDPSFCPTDGLCPIDDNALCPADDICAADSVEPCSEDICTTQDACSGDTTGHVCSQRDVCDTDISGDCRGDECVTDSSYQCIEDACSGDSSGTCSGDQCNTDSAGGCSNDTCQTDSSNACIADKCEADSSGKCLSDECIADSSGECVSDDCTSDRSGICVNDDCLSDSSGDCRSDSCESDNSGACRTDGCDYDSAGTCVADSCGADSSKQCISDMCTSDSSGDCLNDSCIADSSGACVSDDGTSDKSGACVSDRCFTDNSDTCRNDKCQNDSSGSCKADRCHTDSSGDCTSQDVCVLDSSSNCGSDLCRDDRTPIGSECTGRDTCALDLALNQPLDRRDLPRAGLNKAIKWLYRLSVMTFMALLPFDPADADTVIDASNAVFFPDPSFTTASDIVVASPFGSFIRDCDDDGIDEADTNGDGLCNGDPELMDYDGDGSRELPAGTAFAGDFSFECFHIPDDVAIITTGALTIGASREVAIFGVMRLVSSAIISSPVMMDLRTSAWLSEDTPAGFVSGLAGEVDQTYTAFDGPEVPSILFTSICKTAPNDKPPRPTAVNATDGSFSDKVRITFNTVAGATVYRVFRCLTNGQTCGTPIGFPKTGSFDDKKGQTGTIYYYRVRACSPAGCGKFSVANTGYRKALLARPTGIMASDGSFSDKVRITFNTVAGATVYRVFRCETSGQTCGTPIGYPKTGSFDDTKGQSGTVYFYRVRACTATTCGKFSVANTGYRKESLARPIGIRATDGTFSDKVRITFNTVEGATVYRVFRCLSSGLTCGTPIGFPKTGSFDDTKGQSGIIYFYRVRACTATICSKFSVANTGYRGSIPATEADIVPEADMMRDAVQIPVFSGYFGRWLLILLLLLSAFIFRPKGSATMWRM